MREELVLLEKAADAEFFKQDEGEQHHAPEDEVPACPVPETGEEPHDRQRERRARASAAAAAERNVEIVAEPRAERDVPAAVELAHRAGSVGEVKVARHGQPQHLPKAHRHERIPGKIEVELQAVARRAEPRERRRKIAVADALERGPQRRELVGQQHLEAKPDGKALKAEENVVARDRALLERAAPLIVAKDGAHRQLREGEDEGGEVDEIPLRTRAAVHIDEIARALEEVEAHAERQGKMDEGEGLPRQFAQIFQQKCGVLKVDQSEKVGAQAKKQQRPARADGFPIHRASENIVEENGRAQKKRIARARTEKVERGAAEHEHGILAAEGDEIINREKERQKVKKKRKVRKTHGKAPVKDSRLGRIVYAMPARGNGKKRKFRKKPPGKPKCEIPVYIRR